MALRSTSWRDIPAINPTRGARYTPGGLGAWRSIVPAGTTSRSRRRGGRGRQGQANEYERGIARTALEEDDGFDFFNAGGKALLGALDVLDTPGAFLRSGFKAQRDIRSGEPTSLEEVIEGGWRNISGQEALGVEDKGIPGALAGFALDVALDPLTYTPAGAGKIGIEAGKPAARKFLTEGAQQTFGEAAVKQAERAGQTFTSAERAEKVAQQGKILSARAATKTLRTPSQQVLDPLEREIIGAPKGTHVVIPGSKHLKVDRLISRVAPERVRQGRGGRAVFKVTDRELGAGRLTAKARSKVTQSRFGNKMAQGFTKRPELRRQILFGSEHEAVNAFWALEKETAGNLQRRWKDTTWGHKLGETFAKARKAGIKGEDITLAGSGDVDAIARVAAQAAKAGDEKLPDEIREFMPFLWDEANQIDPEHKWLGYEANYVPRRPSEEMIALGRDWGNGGRRFEVFDHERYYGIEEGQQSVFMDETLLPPAQAKGRSVERQMRDIAEGKGYKSYFELDAYKAWPDHVRRLADRYGKEFMFKQLRDVGVLEPSLLAVMKAEGVGFGRRKATLNTKLQKVFADRDTQLTKRVAAQQQLDEVDAAVQLGGDAKKTAQAARREVEDEISDIRTEIGLQDAVAVREYEAVVREELAPIAVQRQALLDNIAAAEDEAFVLEHAVVEQSHKIQMSTYRATEKVTKLEASIADMRDELGDIYERMRLLQGDVDFKAALASVDDLARRAEKSGDAEKWVFYENMKSDPAALRDWAQRNRNLGRFGSETTISRDAQKLMKDAEVRIIELNGKIREGYRILNEFEGLATLPTKHLDRQLDATELMLRQKTAELRGAGRAPNAAETMSNAHRARLVQDVHALGKTRASILHEKAVIERARGRVAALDAQDPSQWVDQVTDLRDIQDQGDKIIHAQFPDLPPEVSGLRVREYFDDRMSDIQKNIDDTEGQVMSAFTDRDTLRSELAVIRQRKSTADRNFEKLSANVGPKEKELAELEAMLLGRADEAAQRAVDIGEAQELAGVKVEGLLQEATTQAEIEATAEQFLSIMEAKQMRYEAQAVKAEASAAGAKKTAATWDRIAANNFSDQQRNATLTALKAQFHEVGKVSVTNERWLVDAIYGASYMDLGKFHRNVFSPVMNWWKAVALSTPGTVIRNFYGATFNNYLSPYNVSLNDYQKAFRFGVAGTTHPARREFLNDADKAIFDQIEQSGLIVGSATSREVERTLGAEIGGPRMNPFSTEFRVWRFFRRGQEDVEKVVRGALAYRVLKDGGTMDDAIGAVTKYHFDYDDLSKWERSAIRSVVPFYTWTRKNLPLMLEQIVQNPQKFNRFYQAKLEIENMSPEEQIVPSYFTENMAVRLPFDLGQGQGYMLPDLPFTSINDVTDPSTAFSQVSPFIKAPIEYAFGKQLFKGIPLKDEYQPVPRWLEAIPGVFPALNAIGKAERGADGNWMMKQKDMYIVESMLPAYGKARRLFPAEDEYSERTLASWLSFGFGAGLRSNTPRERRNEAFKRVNRELERIETEQELGYRTEEDLQPRFGQTVNAAYRYLGIEE